MNFFGWATDKTSTDDCQILCIHCHNWVDHDKWYQGDNVKDEFIECGNCYERIFRSKNSIKSPLMIRQLPEKGATSTTPKICKFNVDVYDAEFYILLHQHGWTFDKVERWIYDEFDRILEVSEDSAAMHVSPKTLHQVIFFGPDAMPVMSVAHECLHATFSVMKNINQTSFNEEEPLCYLHGLIVQKVQGFIDEAEKSKS